MESLCRFQYLLRDFSIPVRLGLPTNYRKIAEQYQYYSGQISPAIELCSGLGGKGLEKHKSKAHEQHQVEREQSKII